jgi:hypothetical protein
MIFHLVEIALLLFLVWKQRPPVAKEHFNDLAVMAAFRAAARQCGVNAESIQPDFDLLSTGKLGEILHHASIELGKPIRTVQDLHDWFK